MIGSTEDDPRKAELFELSRRLLDRRPLIVGSNRGPLEFYLTPEGVLQPRRGSGAIVTALSSLTRSFSFSWVASAMGEGDRRASEGSGGQSIQSPLPNQNVSLRYVITPRRMYHKFYNILCNPLLWFLQHRMWSPPFTPNIDSVVYDAWETGYKPVNQAFAEGIISEAGEKGASPLVMLHDYHLYLVAEMVREQVPDALIYHFIHIPWPAPDLWQLLPAYMRSSVCRSLCNADLVGFQSTWDVNSFLESCRLFVEGAEVDFNQGIVKTNGRETKVRAYPTSIDVEEVRRIATSPRALNYEQRLQQLCGEQTLIRVDRAEPSKNIVRGFRSFHIFLEQHPEFHQRVKFLAFLVPSRTHVKQYERYQEEIENVVRGVNNAFGSETWTPIQVIYENNYTQALAGMRLYDVLVVNPLADGMNLVAKEGPVVNTKGGVLILSEATGAFEQLKIGALAVAPADLQGTAQAIYEALSMSFEERIRRNQILIDAVSNENATHWLLSQMRDLESISQQR
jgi:trehalose 6-phosphate synthase